MKLLTKTCNIVQQDDIMNKKAKVCMEMDNDCNNVEGGDS